MTTAASPAFSSRWPVLLLLAALIGVLVVAAGRFGGDRASLAALGVALGFVLYQGAFGFASAYRDAILRRDMSRVLAQVPMLAVAIVLFAPVLAAGSVFGHPVTGAIAPVSVSMAFGAVLFGVGMQLGGGCASGTLYTVGGGNVRMLIVLVFFCLGGFWGSLDLHRWQQLPGLGPVSLGRDLGWAEAVVLQLLVLAAVFVLLRRGGNGRGRQHLLGGPVRSLTEAMTTWRPFAVGPWPLALTAVTLALLNWLTLLVAGHPWSITWGLTLWAAKLAVAFGWDPAASPFWASGFPAAALARPILADTVSVMNLGVIAGASLAAALAGRLTLRPHLPLIPLAAIVAAVFGGRLMGYGARLSYGCNIGAFFSGIASGSLHGWVWIVCAVAGTVLGIRLRPYFRH